MTKEEYAIKKAEIVAQILQNMKSDYDDFNLFLIVVFVLCISIIIGGLWFCRGK